MSNQPKTATPSAEDVVQPVKYFLPTENVYRNYLALVASALQSAAEEAAKRAREECVEAVCVNCRNGEALERDPVGFYFHRDEVGLMHCYANGILTRWPDSRPAVEEK